MSNAKRRVFVRFDLWCLEGNARHGAVSHRALPYPLIIRLPQWLGSAYTGGNLKEVVGWRN
jgi:hypothetical protein